MALLLSPDAAAALDIDTVAYDTNVAPTQAYNVSVYMKPDLEAETIGNATVNVTKVLLGFPAFTTLHYDPTVELTSPADVGYTTTNTSNTTAAANAASGARPGAQAALGVVAALAAVLLL